jgi:hypothetical protein
MFLQNLFDLLHGGYQIPKRYDGLSRSRHFRRHMVIGKPSRISHVVKRMPKNPTVTNIEKYIPKHRLASIQFRKANNLPV